MSPLLVMIGFFYTFWVGKELWKLIIPSTELCGAVLCTSTANCSLDKAACTLGISKYRTDSVPH
eukprot:8973865-Ditylum_brightwellii.AAC.1